MNGESEIARKIVQRLDDGLHRLDAGTLEGLTAARRAALARHREAPATVAGLAWAGAAGRFVSHHLFGTRVAVAVATLVIATAGVLYWQNATAPNGDVADLEISLLTDELPINAYLDKGFDSWLKRSPR